MGAWIKRVENHVQLLSTNWLGRIVLLVLLFALLLPPVIPVFRRYLAYDTSAVLAAVLVALTIAVILHARFLVLLQRDNQETVSTLDATGREFKSIFENALDGILILDNRAVCLDANPAASLILGVPRKELLGNSIARFYADPNVLTENWNSLLEKRHLRGRVDMLSADGCTLLVEFAASAN